MIYRLIRAARTSVAFLGLLVAIGAAVVVVLGFAAWMFNSPIKVYGNRLATPPTQPKVDATGKVATCPAGRFLVRFPPGTEPELVCLSGSIPSWEKPSDALRRGGRQ